MPQLAAQSAKMPQSAPAELVYRIQVGSVPAAKNNAASMSKAIDQRKCHITCQALLSKINTARRLSEMP